MKLPRHCRVIVLSDRFGYITAVQPSGTGISLAVQLEKGFRPVFQFRAPLRRTGRGWKYFYDNFLRHYTIRWSLERH